MIKLQMIMVFLLLCLTSSSVIYGADPAINDIINTFSRAEKLFKSYSLYSNLIQYQNNQKKDEANFVLTVDNENSLALYLSPLVNKGKIVLQKDQSYYLYFPKPNNYIRISGRSNLFGNVSYGDLLRPPVLKYYEIKEYKVLQDDKGEEIYVISFSQKDGVTNLTYYQKVIYFNLNKQRIEAIESFSRTGVMLGRIENLEFEVIDGINFPVKTKIVDIRNPDVYTIQTNSQVKITQLPAEFFTPGYLSNVANYLKLKLGVK